MKYVFGPVPSRRLGQSLGIDPVPAKTCNWNCVYCQLGRTGPLDHDRKDYVPNDVVVAEVLQSLDTTANHPPDWLTIVGSGEPTLHAGLGDLIRRLKQVSTIPLAVITNGSLLCRADVRHDLSRADLVIPSLDAGSEAIYRRVNRAVAELDFPSLVAGLIAFREEFAGRLWIETMLIKGINDSDEALEDLANVLRRIGPDEVHLNLPVRPPAEPWVASSNPARIARAVEILGAVARVVPPSPPQLQFRSDQDVVQTIIDVVSRHPMKESELVDALRRWDPNKVESTLERLAASGAAKAVTRGGERFWTGSAHRYTDPEMSRCHGAPRSDDSAGPDG